VTLRQTHPPARLQLTKYYFRPQIDNLSQQQDEVRSLGPAATQEWYKGLEARGQSQTKDATRFEQWQPVGPVYHSPPDQVSNGQVSGSTSPAYSLTSATMHNPQVSHQSLQRPFSAQGAPLNALTSGMLMNTITPLFGVKTRSRTANLCPCRFSNQDSAQPSFDAASKYPSCTWPECPS
jgi:hypothetical protein